VWSSTHWCWECSTLSTGSTQLAPNDEWALRWRDWSAFAYIGVARRSMTKRRHVSFEFILKPCLRFVYVVPWDNFPGQPRCTWVNALPDSTRRLCLATKIFSSKRRRYAYSGLHILHISPLCALDSTGVCWSERFSFFQKKCFFRKALF